MSFLTRYLNQVVTYWSNSGVDEYGQPTFGAPQTIKVRWEDRADQTINPDGTTGVSAARLFLAQDVAIGDFFFNGISSATNPRSVATAHRVMSFRKIPDLSGKVFERKAYLE